MIERGWGRGPSPTGHSKSWKNRSRSARVGVAHENETGEAGAPPLSVPKGREAPATQLRSPHGGTNSAMAGPPSRSSFPSVPGEPRVRRLGVGSSGGGDRPLRSQVVVALVCVAMLIAVPLYLWRKPSTKTGAVRALASASASAGPQALPKPSATSAAPPAPPPRLTLGAVQKVRCGASATAMPNEGTLCDTLGPFEEALKKAVLNNEDCAPKAKVKGSINYVLTVDFAHKKLHIFPGASGEWHGKQARRATSCVGNAVKVADWNIPHQYRFYSIALLATYAGPPGSEPLPAPSAAPAQPAGPILPTFE
jgi:hypothetical protein